MFAVVLAGLLFADTNPEPAPPVPRGVAPLLLPATIKDGKLVSERAVRVVVPVATAMKVIVNGREETRTVISYREEQRMEISAWDLKRAKISQAGGKKIDVATLKKLLAKPRLVVFSADGRAIDPAYLKVFAKDTLVIVAPPEGSKAPQPKAPPDVPRRPR